MNNLNKIFSIKAIINNKAFISLMEFYVVIKYNLSHYDFISKQFDNKEIRKCYWNQEIIIEYHLKTYDKINDNVISRYVDEDLSIRIKHLAFRTSAS